MSATARIIPTNQHAVVTPTVGPESNDSATAALAARMRSALIFSLLVHLFILYGITVKLPDPSLLEDPRLLNAALAAVRLMAANQRMAAEVRSGVEQYPASPGPAASLA